MDIFKNYDIDQVILGIIPTNLNRYYLIALYLRHMSNSMRDILHLDYKSRMYDSELRKYDIECKEEDVIDGYNYDLLKYRHIKGFDYISIVSTQTETDKYLFKKVNCLSEVIVGMYALNLLGIPNFAKVYGMLKNEYIVYEYVKSSISYKEFISICTKEELLQVLKQLIYALKMANHRYNYTHYDIHHDNILIVKYVEEQHITYTWGDTIKTVDSYYVPVIIDYDRCHIRLDGKDIGSMMYEHVSVYHDKEFILHDIFRLLICTANNCVNIDIDYKLDTYIEAINKNIDVIKFIYRLTKGSYLINDVSKGDYILTKYRLSIISKYMEVNVYELSKILMMLEELTNIDIPRLIRLTCRDRSGVRKVINNSTQEINNDLYDILITTKYKIIIANPLVYDVVSNMFKYFSNDVSINEYLESNLYTLYSSKAIDELNIDDFIKFVGL